MCDLVGYSREEILEGTVSDISAVEEGYTSERARETVRRVMATGESETLEWKLETADGEHRWLEVHATPAVVGGEQRYLSITRDVTAQRRREREYEQIFNRVSDAVTIHDPETGDIIDANETMCELTGYSRQEVLERDIEGLSVTEEGYTGERAREVIQRVMATGESETLEWKLETADGEHRWLEVSGRPATIGGEKRYLAINRDVTERRRREREYEQVFDGVTDAIAIHDPTTGEIIEVNATYAELLGYDRETIVEEGLDLVSDTAAGYTAERGRELLDRVMAGEPVDGVEWRMVTADGERRWFDVELTEATIGGQQRALAICRDVTERRERQRLIEEERRKYSTLIEQSTDGVVVVSDGEYVFVNERFVEITGYDETELLGAPVESVFADEYRELVRERYRRRVEGESPPNQYDVEIETPDGERVVLELAVSEIVHEGEPATMATFRDVTERRRREEQLRRSEQQFRQIAEAVDEVIHLAAPDLSETYYLSPAYEEIWGRPLEEMYEDPLSFRETLHPEDRERFTSRLDRLSDVWTDPERSGDDVEEFEYRVQRDDDTLRWIEGRIYPIRDEDGRVSRVVSVSRDVTERRRRERTLESFQEATAELTTADSAADASRTAVDAAAELFDLERVAVHLHEEGSLVPAAATDRLGPPGELPTWTAGDGPAWEAFVDREPVSVGPDEAPTTAVRAEASALVVPLSRHGVLTVWAAEPDLETVHLIAATLEGALNHIVGERRLESTRERLQRQAERAEQMERIAELNRRVESALTDQSDRIGVERTVCEQLVDIEPFTAAWTAEAEGGSDRLTPRTAAGLALEDVERVVDGEAGRSHPAREAWRTGEVVVATDLVGAGDWRRELLRTGAQAVCAIPLSYEGIIHGVLTVRAGSSDAFDGPGRETIEQLGNTIGNAITAIERRRALESDETIELEFRDDDSTVPFARLAEASGCQVRHDRTVRRRDGAISVVYTVIGDVPEDVEAVAERSLPGEVELLRRADDEAVIRRDGTSWFGSILSAYGSVLRRGRATPEQTTLVVELPTEADTRQFVDGLKERIPGVELYAKRQHRAAEEAPGEVSARIDQRLSERQQEALETAYRMGYFEWPREHGGQEVAEAMDITQPTLNKHLRLAERKVFDLVVDADE
jgi:PAS domain S-box-containing protein